MRFREDEGGGGSLPILGLALGSRAASAVAAALPRCGLRLAWWELGNKLEAFRRFREGRAGRSGGRTSGAATAEGNEIFDRMWRREGEGYRRAETARRCAGGMVPLAPGGTQLSPGELLPLHSGAGLSLATHVLASVSAPGGPSLDEALDRFTALARGIAVPGWEGAVLEALGFIVRTLHPRWLTAVDRRLSSGDGILWAYFWHGVGRGLYFTRGQAIPAGDPPRRALARALAEPPTGDRRDQVVAGLTWALTLVNLPHPEVLEGLLRAEASTQPAGPGLEHGATAALLIWHETAGHDPLLEAFLRHEPPDEETALAWRRRVREPFLRTLEGPAPVLRSTGRWGELFRFRPLGQLENELRMPSGDPR